MEQAHLSTNTQELLKPSVAPISVNDLMKHDASKLQFLHALFLHRLDALHKYYVNFLASFLVFLAINSALLTGLISVTTGDKSPHATIQQWQRMLQWQRVFGIIGIGLALLYIFLVWPQFRIGKRLLHNIGRLNVKLGNPLFCKSTCSQGDSTTTDCCNLCGQGFPAPMLRCAGIGFIVFTAGALVGWVYILWASIY